MPFLRHYSIIATAVFSLFFCSSILYAAEVTDMAGRKVKTPHDARRIVTTFKPATLCVISLGLAERLVGVDRVSRTDKLQIAVFPGIAKVPSVGDRGGGLNFETIVSLNPDLVVLFSQLDGVATAKRFERLGIASVIIKPESFSDIQRSLDVIAQAAGQPHAAKRAIDTMNKTVDMVKAKVGNPSKRPTVYYASPMGLFSTVSGDMLQTLMISLAGGRSVSAGLSGHFQPISPEQLVAWRPDFITVSRYCPEDVPQIFSKAQFSYVPAIRDGRVYVFPSNLAPWDYPSPLSALGVAWLAWRLHPDTMSDVDMIQLTEDFHRSLFGKSFSQLGGDFGPLQKAPR